MDSRRTGIQLIFVNSSENLSCGLYHCFHGQESVFGVEILRNYYCYFNFCTVENIMIEG